MVVGGWEVHGKGGDEMFYRVIKMFVDGQSVRSEYEYEDRPNMLEWVKVLVAQSDTAYVDVILIDEDGRVVNRKFIEGRAFDEYVDNV